MREVLPDVYEFTTARGSVLFDSSSSTIAVFEDGVERVFPYPVNIHAFCVVIGGLLYGREVGRKALFKIGKPGERKVMELRLIPVRKKVGVSGSGDNDGAVSENGKAEYRGALLTFIDEKEGFKRSVMFNRPNLYALWEMFRAQDKVVGIGDFVFEKKEGSVFLQGVYVPYQKVKSSFYILDRYLRTGSIPGVNQEWEYGKLMFWNRKKRVDFFRKVGETLIPAGALRLSFEDALRMLSVL